MTYFTQKFNTVLLFGLVILTTLTSCSDNSSQTDIVVTLKPVHSIILALTEHTGLKVELLGGGISSPHQYAMKPSDMQQLKRARLVVQVSPDLERFLAKPLQSLPPEKKYSLIHAKNLTLLPSASGSAHTHDDSHQHNKTASLTAPDLHIWLDPRNMITITHQLQAILGKRFPKQSFLIKQNELKLTGLLKGLDLEIAETLQPVKGRAFMVYHNAFRYFENRYGLKNMGSLTLSSHTLPGSKHIITIRNRLKQDDIKCLFTEPGQQPPLVKVLAENSAARIVPLSALGTALKPSPHLYFQMMRELARGYKDCLLKES